MLGIFYLLSFVGLWNRLRSSLGWLYAVAYTYTIIFSLIIIGVVLSQLITGVINYYFVATLTFILSATIFFKSKQSLNKINIVSPYTVAVACILCLIVVYVYGFNSVRFYGQRGMSIPVVGTNDDNANHMAMAIISIKDQTMLMSSKIMQRMIEDQTVIPATKWYPFGLYANMHVGYVTYKNLLGISDMFDVRSFFSFDTIFTVGLLLNFLVLFYALVDRIYKVRTVYTFALVLTVGFMVVLGEFFLKLQLFGFHSQLAGYCAFIALLLTLDTAGKESKLSFYSLFLICLFTIAVGTSYYLFIPLAGLAYFTSHTNSPKDWRRMIPYAALVISSIPLLFFNFIFPIKEQSSAYGVAFVGFTGLMTAAAGILLSVLMRKGVNEWFRRMLILQFGLNIVMMVLGTIVMYSTTGNFGYYFFKSYWTMGVLGLPLFVATVGYFGDLFQNKPLITRLIFLITGIIIASGIFYTVFAQPGFDSRGYDNVLVIHNGLYNYPFDQKKWIKTYEKYGVKNGKNIFTIGIWGQTILARALYEDKPDSMKSNYPHSNGMDQNTVVYIDIISRLLNKRKTILLDSFNQIHTINKNNNSKEERELFNKSPYLE